MFEDRLLSLRKGGRILTKLSELPDDPESENLDGLMKTG